MRTRATSRAGQKQAGIALLISIFVLLLISVVAIALIVSSGTETALAGNYRSSTGVYYAAMAGLEEVRARLLTKNPNAFKTTDPSFLPAGPLPVCNTYYVLNPLGSEAVTPWVSGSTYEDKEFGPEFLSSGCSVPSAPPTANSIWQRPGFNSLPFPGPFYKWVRINAVSELSLNVDVSPYDGTKSSTTPVYYDGTNLNDQGNGSQVLEITALAVLPNGSQKLVQYLAAPAPINIPTPAALTLAGNANVAFHAPATNSSYAVKGNDQNCFGFNTGTNYPAIGVFTNADKTTVINGIPFAYRPNYTGQFFAPDVENIGGSFPDTPAQLDALAQTIVQNADVIVPQGSAATQTAFLTSLGMSSTNLLTVGVNGDLDVSNWSNTGYGTLVVTGTFTYDPDTTWNGIVLVIGKGVVNNSQNGNFKQINGAMIVAKSRDNLGNVLSSYGAASMTFLDAMQGDGIHYNNCWIQKAMPSSDFKILSFHEIAQ